MAGWPDPVHAGRSGGQGVVRRRLFLFGSAVLVLCLPAWAGQSEDRVRAGGFTVQASGLPRIGHSDTILQIEALRFAPVPPAINLAILNDYDAGVLDWNIFVDRSWLSVTPAAAVSNSTDVAIWITNTDAELGRHTGHLIIRSSNAVNTPDTVWVLLDMLCPVQVQGDANYDGRLSQADIIYVVNHVLRGGAPPRPVWQSGDINCDELLSQSDIIALVNHLLRAGPSPCNVCQFF